MMKTRKKGVSEMVGYVLLIVIAITLSIIVYIWIQKYIPRQSAECEDSISLSVEDYCMYKNLTGDLIMVQVSVKNRGLFNVDGFFIRESNDSEKAIYPMNNNETAGVGKVYLPGFRPNQYYCGSFNDTAKYNTITNIEIEPFKIKGKDIILCYKSIVNVKVEDFICAESLCNSGASDGGSPREIDNIIEDGTVRWDNDLHIYIRNPIDIIEAGNMAAIRVGFVEFDITKITNPNIAKVEVKLTVNQLNTPEWLGGCSVDSMTNRPLTTADTPAGNQILFNDATGTAYINSGIFCETLGEHVIDLGPQAVLDLISAINIRKKWFAIGISTNGAGESQISAEESLNPPKLIITYNPTP